jgi:hypothetical protein
MSISSRVFPIFSCNCFKVSDVTLKSLIHLVLIFVQGKR